MGGELGEREVFQAYILWLQPINDHFFYKENIIK